MLPARGGLPHTFPSLESSTFYIHGRRLLEEGCNISFMSQVICRVPIPLFPKRFKIVLPTFLLMHDYLKVISRNFHNSPLRYRLQLSHLPDSDTEITDSLLTNIVTAE